MRNETHVKSFSGSSHSWQHADVVSGEKTCKIVACNESLKKNVTVHAEKEKFKFELCVNSF